MDTIKIYAFKFNLCFNYHGHRKNDHGLLIALLC